MWRLYIGGLSHLVTQKDLRDRFGKFGDVEDVEIRTRRDEDGVPYKTFGYINIRMSEANLKKCLTVLNKSKWKGGTLQIEAAKESFLHRLAREQQAAAEQHLHQPPVEDKRQKMIDSLSRAGVKNFTMKSGVPGTEVPGNKNWVVSKFGRVLPILQLRCRKGIRVQTVKYDPSKYSHNIRKLDGSSEDKPTPITQLTWELKGGDDDISKKRRGEFPPFESSRPKTIQTGIVNRFKENVDSQTNAHEFSNGYRKPVNHRLAQKMVTDSDNDSDEEIRRMVAAQHTSNTALRQQVDEDNLEVVGFNYLVRSDCSCQNQKGSAVGLGENDNDSTDTDELLTYKKPPLPLERLVPPSAHHSSGNGTNQKIKLKRKHKSGEEDNSSDKEDYLISCRPSSTQQGEDSTKQAASLSEFHIDDDEKGLESADSDYNAMVSNVTHLEISLADLQRLAEESQPTSETTATTKTGSSSKKEVRLTLRQYAPKKATTPEEILASLLEEDSSEDEQNKKNKKRKINMSMPLPTFQGTRALREEESERGEGGRPGGNKKPKLDSESPQLNIQKNTETEKIADSIEEMEEEDGLPSSSSFSSEEDEDEQFLDSSKDAKKATSTPTQHNMSSSSKEEAEEAKQDCYRMSLRPKEEEERQRRANMRRLTAIQQRQKKAEEHKMLIQGALAKPDATTAGAGKHIVFGSDEEENYSGDKPQTPIEVMKSKKMLFEDSQSEDETSGDEASPNERGSVKEKLFSGGGGDVDEDGSRFVIRSQFEGPAGQKLMELQSCFGADERFRMDSRFKNDEEKEKKCMTEEEEFLEEERKKNLSILQSVLDSSQQICCSEMAIKARTFRDVSALHYDPSREEHSAFETSATENKESKSARRMKKEEAQKYPEVSMEIYYDVFGDLKAAFAPVKDKEAGGEEKTSWDQLVKEKERVKEEQTNSLFSLFSANDNSEKRDSSGFKFSFFGDNTEMGSIEAAYKVESIQAPNMFWKQDQLFHGSSSEDDDLIEDVEQSSTVDKTKEQEMSSKTDRFFFFPDDSRLTEGPRLFCRSSYLEQRELWQEKRNALRQEYRKKHKNAKRKLKSSQK